MKNFLPDELQISFQDCLNEITNLSNSQSRLEGLLRELLDKLTN
jgi:hypothetical protein